MDWRAERGSMLIEVAFVMVLLLLPLFYLVGTVARIQAGAYAASAGAREAGRAYVTATEETGAASRGTAAAQLVFDSYGFAAGQTNVSISCAALPCLTPGSRIQISTVVEVPLPLIPNFLAETVPSTVSMTSRHTEAVDAFRGD